MKTKDQLIEMLDNLNISYEISEDPKLILEDGTEINYEDIPAPSEYFKNL